MSYAAEELLGRLGDRLYAADREVCDELFRAGEWGELGVALGAQLRDVELADAERELLAALRP